MKIKITKTSHRLPLITLLTVAGGILPYYTNAATRAWSGITGGNWSIGGAGGNWTEVATPVNNDVLVFIGTTNATTNNDIANLTVGNANNSNTTIALQFPNTGDGESFNLSGAAINLNGAINSGREGVSPRY